MVQLYSKKGDKGKTSLRSGIRCNKADPRVEAYGTIDELNCAIAVAIAETQNLKRKTQSELNKIQSDLFHIGALLSGEPPLPKFRRAKAKRLELLEKRVGELEKEIDKIQKGLPKQSNFYIPGVSKQSAYLDFARAICRRAERRIVALSDVKQDTVEPDIIMRLVKYTNRLSDYLYVLARRVNQLAGVEEKEWASSAGKK